MFELALGRTAQYELKVNDYQVRVEDLGCSRRHGTAHHDTTHHHTAQHSTARHGTARHGTAQHSMYRLPEPDETKTN